MLKLYDNFATRGKHFKKCVDMDLCAAGVIPQMRVVYAREKVRGASDLLSFNCDRIVGTYRNLNETN